MQLNFNTEAEQLQTHSGMLLSTPGLPALQVDAVKRQRLKCEQNNVVIRLPVQTFAKLLEKLNNQELSQIPTVFDDIVPGDLSPDRFSVTTDRLGALRVTDLCSKLKNTVTITPDQLQYINTKIVEPYVKLRDTLQKTSVSEIS